MCTNCNFCPKTSKREFESLIKQMDAVIAFKGKIIKEISVTPKQYKLLQDALPEKEIELHTPMRRNGVLIKLAEK